MKNKRLIISILAGVMAAVMILSLLMQLIPVQAHAATSDEIKDQIGELEKDQEAIQNELKDIVEQRRYPGSAKRPCRNRWNHPGNGCRISRSCRTDADDTMNVAAADAAGSLGGDTAGAHGADTAAGACFAEAAMGGLVLDALLPGVGADLVSGFQQASGRLFHFFNCD